MAIDQVTTGLIKDDAVTAAKIVAGAVEADISAGSIDTAELAADAVDGTKIADDAINSEHVTDGSIDLAHLSADSVDGTKIVDNAINSEHYTDASIDEAHIAADAVNFATHLKAGTDGELITWNASGDPAAVAVGTVGHVLTSGGTGVAPTFQVKEGVTADHVKRVASGAITGTQNIDVQQCFADTDYTFYRLVVAGYAIPTAGYLQVGFLDQSNNHLSATYYVKGKQWYTNASGGGFNMWNDPVTSHTSQISMNDTDGFRVNNTWAQNVSSWGQMCTMDIYHPRQVGPSASGGMNLVHFMSSWAETTYLGWGFGMGIQNTTTAKYGLRISTSTNIFSARGNWAVYAHKM